MKLLKEYTTLSEVLTSLKKQVIESVPFAENIIPDHIDSCEDLYYWLKQNVVYKSDPRTRELLMTMQTMFNGSRTGVKGAGDCDDFTITSLASLSALGYNQLYVVLVGYVKDLPVHIYAAVYDNGSIKWFDLTNSEYNYQRDAGPKGKYIYQQILKFEI